MVFIWRRLDRIGLEVLRLEERADGILAQADIVSTENGGVALSLDWELDAAWRTARLRLTQRSPENRTLLIERAEPHGFRVNGAARGDLDFCAEIDVSATPFCNTLAIRRLGLFDRSAGWAGELTVAYVDVPELTVVPSRQEYRVLGPKRFRYVDHGVADGFEATLTVDDRGLIEHYEGLFERV